MTDLLAVTLPSGVGVRFRDLTPSEGDKILLAAGKTMTEGSTQADLELAEIKMGIEAMLQEVTNGPCKLKKVEVPLLGKKNEDGTQAMTVVEEGDINHPENRWVEFDPDNYDKVFKNKDHSTLKGIYVSRNRAFRTEVDAILGKAVTVVK